MLQSFYKYIVKELLLGYFKEHHADKGSRYFILTSNRERRDLLLEAIHAYAQPITISGIYQGQIASAEESYATVMLQPEGSIPLIVGEDRSATEDYLTTLRNAVGKAGGKYENYALLYVISDSNNSLLSSIDTTVRNLQSAGGPLSPEYIIANIQKEAKDAIHKKLEQDYLDKYLESIKEQIFDGTCTLYDFKNALTVLDEGTLKGHFNDLDFFEDKTIYVNSYQPEPAEIKQRIAKNQEMFSKISDIMRADEDVDRVSYLEKILDEKLSARLAKNPKWKQTDFQDILDSMERKAETANLELIDVKLVEVGLLTTMFPRRTGSKKKSKNFIVVCDQTGGEHVTIKLTFNKKIKDDSEKKAFIVKDRTATVVVKDDFVSMSIGKNDNHHDFYIVRLACDKRFFSHAADCFVLSKRGLTITPPEDADEIVFGKEDKTQELPLDNNVEWTDDLGLKVPLLVDDDQDKIDFDVTFPNRKEHVTIKLYASKAVPPKGPEAFPPRSETFTGVDGDKGPFTKISDGTTDFAITGYWRRFLEWEKAMIDNKCTCLQFNRDELTNSEVFVPETRPLSQMVQQALNALYAYFEQKNSVPSLTPLTDDLKKLYKAYWDAVRETIDHIPTTRALDKEEYNMAWLGVVVDWNRYYLSPFHPMVVAYILEYDRQYDEKEDSSFARKLLSPFYLLPFIFLSNNALRPYTNKDFSKLSYWLSYEGVNSEPQERANDITMKMVKTKIDDFITHFPYLFQDKDCPIIISAIGIPNDANVIKGIVEYIKKQMDQGVQRIELHEYVSDLMAETYFEKLNRLDSVDAITRDLESEGIKMSVGEHTSQEIIHQLFTRVSFYKHQLNKQKPEIGYCHIAFYQMDGEAEYIKPSTNDSRVELSMGGLISVPSTLKKADTYTIGFGTRGLPQDAGGYIYPMAVALNNLYANERNEGSNLYQNCTCVAKKYKFSSAALLNNIYDNANWVTFINPEVDINFFYKQNLYVVHYTDQYTINAKYDSITVTKRIDQYENMLRRSYQHYALKEETFDHFNSTMLNYFNCLNGSWMLSIVNKTEYQIREKMSIVAASIAMQKLMKRNGDIIWIPVSLEEILRVTRNIGLPEDYIFTKKALGVTGAMSDDLLMMGLDCTDHEQLKLYLYPVEVKLSKNSNDFAKKGGEQVSKTCMEFRRHLMGERNFTKDIYRTFFASQMLTNAEKLNANYLLSDEVYEKIEQCRFNLLNLRFTIEPQLPVKEMGGAALVSFFSSAAHSLSTVAVEDVAVCEVHFSEKECFQFVADPASQQLDFLESQPIVVDNDAQEIIDGKNNADVDEDDVVDITNTDDTGDPADQEDAPQPIVPGPVMKDEPLDKTPEETTSAVQPIRIIMGHTPSSNREIVFEPNNTNQVTHPNMGIIGTMGTGKTQFARSAIAQFSKETEHNVGGQPVGILVFDYKGDYKDKEFLDAVNGKCYKYMYPFNPLKLVMTEDMEGMNLPAITADRISDSFAKAYGLGLKQQSNIKQVIIATYEDAGITRNPSTWTKPAPTMEQVIDKYFETYDANDKAYALFDKLRDYTIFTPDNSTCVSLFEWLKGVRVIDLTLYPDDTKKVIVSLILDLFYAEMKQLGGSRQQDGFRELRAMIMVDEAHQFLKKDFNSLRSIISEGRMFGVGMILSTQNIDDFKTAQEDYSQFILSWVIHHVNSVSKAEIASIFGASDPNGQRYMDFISKAKQFMSICKIGAKVEGIRDLPYFELVKEDSRFVEQ